MTFDDVRKLALAWPEVEDGISYRTPALKVRKKLLARLKEDGDSVVIPGVPPDERDMLLERAPKVFYFTDHYRDYPIVLARLSNAKQAMVETLLRRQWQALASKKALASVSTARLAPEPTACRVRRSIVPLQLPAAAAHLTLTANRPLEPTMNTFEARAAEGSTSLVPSTLTTGGDFAARSAAS